MRPLTIITGIVLGSAFSIGFGLSVVLLIFAIISDDYPRVEAEYRPLLISIALFLSMTVIAAVSFFGLLKSHRLGYWFQIPLWLSVIGVGFYYWPT